MSSKDTVTREQFASLVLKLLSGKGENDWTKNLTDFSLQRETASGPKVLQLSRLYQDYLAVDSPENFQTLTKRIDSLLSSKPLQVGATELLSCLLPCLRTYVSLQQLNDACRKQPDSTHANELVFFPYADVLGIGLVIDKGETMQHVRYLELEKLNTGVEDAIDIAVQNLTKLSSAPLRVVQPGFYTSPWKDSYDGARLLLTNLFTDVKVAGDIVALSPTPDSLFVTGSQDPLGLELLTALGHGLMKSSSCVAALPLVLQDGIWQPFVLHVDDPAFDTINSYRMNILNQLYQAQDALLSHQATRQAGTFISPFALDTDKTSKFFFSKTSVLEDSACIMPETDVVEFFRRSAEGKKECVARASFETVLQVLNQTMLKDPTSRPCRWHLSVFPSATELSQLAIMPPLQSPRPTTAFSELTELSRLFSLALPNGVSARQDSQLEKENNELMIHFVLNCTPVELRDFYLKSLPIGNYMILKGDFYEAQVHSAHCTREVLFGPGERHGETLLRWCSRVDYNTQSIVNALSKQTNELLSFEQFFGISIINESRPDGELRLIEKTAIQDFVCPHPPEVVATFFRCQMSPLKPIYMPPEDGSPHVIMAINTMTIVIKSTPSPEGTIYYISRD
ncbi:MAG: hypothetical protein SGJ27_11755 [Candidatus Melainabacteria bacterium]|nr:hypothetical protein [Candidatus Melainabacteria bacterium]